MGWPCTCQLSKVHHARGSYLSLSMFSWQEMSCETLSSVLEPEGATWGQGDEARNGSDHHLPSYPTPTLSHPHAVAPGPGLESWGELLAWVLQETGRPLCCRGFPLCSKASSSSESVGGSRQTEQSAS